MAAGVDGMHEGLADEQTITPSGELRAALEGVSPTLFRVLRRMGVTMGEVDDALQGVLMQLAGRWEALRLLPPEELRAYACAAAAGVAIDVARRRSRSDARLVPLEVDPELDQPGPDDALEHQQSLEILDEILAGIPAERRIVFILFEIEELGLQEIADRLGIPRGTVASRLRKAREEFERAVARRRVADERRGMTR
jgi:RNA polymerase sigma-70 factor (ECF subfamily)